MAEANKAMPAKAQGHASQRRCWREPGTSAKKHVASTKANSTGCQLSTKGVAAGRLTSTQGMSAQWTMHSNDKNCPKLSNPTCLTLTDTNPPLLAVQKNTDETKLQ